MGINSFVSHDRYNRYCHYFVITATVINKLDCNCLRFVFVFNLLFLGESNLDSEEEERRQNDAITVCQFLCAKLDEGVK